MLEREDLKIISGNNIAPWKGNQFGRFSINSFLKESFMLKE